MSKVSVIIRRNEISLSNRQSADYFGFSIKGIKVGDVALDTTDKEQITYFLENKLLSKFDEATKLLFSWFDIEAYDIVGLKIITNKKNNNCFCFYVEFIFEIKEVTTDDEILEILRKGMTDIKCGNYGTTLSYIMNSDNANFKKLQKIYNLRNRLRFISEQKKGLFCEFNQGLDNIFLENGIIDAKKETTQTEEIELQYEISYYIAEKKFNKSRKGLNHPDNYFIKEPAKITDFMKILNTLYYTVITGINGKFDGFKDLEQKNTITEINYFFTKTADKIFLNVKFSYLPKEDHQTIKTTPEITPEPAENLPADNKTEQPQIKAKRVDNPGCFNNTLLVDMDLMNGGGFLYCVYKGFYIAKGKNEKDFVFGYNISSNFTQINKFPFVTLSKALQTIDILSSGLTLSSGPVFKGKKPGDVVDDDFIDEIISELPPITFKRIIMFGEPYGMTSTGKLTYPTYVKIDYKWIYFGEKSIEEMENYTNAKSQEEPQPPEPTNEIFPPEKLAKYENMENNYNQWRTEIFANLKDLSPKDKAKRYLEIVYRGDLIFKKPNSNFKSEDLIVITVKKHLQLSNRKSVFYIPNNDFNMLVEYFKTGEAAYCSYVPDYDIFKSVKSLINKYGFGDDSFKKFLFENCSSLSDHTRSLNLKNLRQLFDFRVRSWEN